MSVATAEGLCRSRSPENASAAASSSADFHARACSRDPSESASRSGRCRKLGLERHLELEATLVHRAPRGSSPRGTRRRPVECRRRRGRPCRGRSRRGGSRCRRFGPSPPSASRRRRARRSVGRPQRHAVLEVDPARLEPVLGPGLEVAGGSRRSRRRAGEARRRRRRSSRFASSAPSGRNTKPPLCSIGSSETSSREHVEEVRERAVDDAETLSRRRPSGRSSRPGQRSSRARSTGSHGSRGRS